jgi:citrate lyase subunit beta/citryl-CoA lyase
VSVALLTLGPALLFCPGDRPERFAKARAAADNPVLDLEDGVGAANKGMARTAVASFLKEAPERTIVRINRPLTELGGADVAAIAAGGARTVLLPKTEAGAEIAALRQASAVCADLAIIATIETARGVLALGDILAQAGVVAVSWGPYDLAADLGLTAVRAPDGRYLGPIEQIRNQILLHAAAAGVAMLDTVTTEIANTALLQRDVAEAALLGMSGKFVVHPSQVAAVRTEFTPPAEVVARSRRMLDAADGRAVFLFEGEMVDEPILRRAKTVVARAERGSSLR